MKKFALLGIIAVYLLVLSPTARCSFLVRVLLSEKPIATNDGTLWNLSTSGQAIISDLDDKNRRQKINTKELAIGLSQNTNLTINKKKLLATRVKIQPNNGLVTYDGHTYRGYFYIIKNQDTVELVNVLELESYVECGLRWEMPPHWPPAALEAGAIVYRTYLLATLRASRARHKKLNKKIWFDIKCSPCHQVYKGSHQFSSVYNAVKKTRGLVVTYNKEPIMALYDSCCAGSIPAQRACFDFKKQPYLARFRRCTYCKKCPCFAWSYSCTLEELTRLLKAQLGIKCPIRDIRIASKDRAGVVQRLKMKTGNRWTMFPPGKLRLAVKKIKSCTFTITRHKDTITFRGSGLGHQMGFCQWGAAGLAARGRTHSQIVHYFYPGVEITRMNDGNDSSKIDIRQPKLEKNG